MLFGEIYNTGEIEGVVYTHVSGQLTTTQQIKK